MTSRSPASSIRFTAGRSSASGWMAPVFLGPTPLQSVTLPKGSYELILRHEGYRAVQYPVWIERLEQDRVAART